MIKEIVESVTGKATNIVQASELKFLAIINPRENNLVHASIKMALGENGTVNINASIFKDELVHFKCKMQLQH